MKKKTRVRKIIRRTAIAMLGVFIIIALVIAVTLNFVFTPEKITPRAVQLINENIRGEVQCERIDLTFFTSFPRFGIHLEKGLILSPDNGSDRDTLAGFNEARLSFDLYRLLKDRHLYINNVKLYRPAIHAVVDSLGTPNWEILEPVTDAPEEETEETDFALEKIVLKNLEIIHANLLYEDGISKVNYQVSDFNLKVRAAKSEKGLFLKVRNQSDHVSIYKDPERPYRINEIITTSTLFYSRADSTLHIRESDISLNDIHFSTTGKIVMHPEKRELTTALDTRLTTNSFKNIMELVPSRILHKERVGTRGEIDLQLAINGTYGKDSYPQIDASLRIDHAGIAYKDFPGTIDNLSASVTSTLFPDRSRPSVVNIEALKVEGTGIHLDASGKIDHLFENALFNVTLDGDIDFTRLYDNFPVDEAIDARGSIGAHLRARFHLADLQTGHYENVDLTGDVQFNDLEIDSPGDSLRLSAKRLNTSFYKQKDRYNTIAGNVDISDTRLNYKESLDFSTEELKADFKVEQTGEKEARLNGTVALREFRFIKPSDSLRAIVRRARVEASLFPEENGKPVYILSQFTIDSAGMRQGKAFVGIKQGSYNIRLDKKEPKKWMPKGKVNFHRLYAYSPELGIPLKMPASRISFENDNLTLDHAKLRFGHSDVTLTGNVQHVAGFKNGELVTATLDVEAGFVDANQLMQAFSTPTTEGGEEDFGELDRKAVADTVNAGKHVFRIPDNLRFSMKTDIDRLKFGTLDLNTIKGNLEVKDGRLKLNNLSLNTLAARLEADMTYSAANNREAELDFRFYLSHIEMDKIHRVLPVLDSLFPMTRSFEGRADFRMKGHARLNGDMNIRIPTLNGIAALKAHEVMVLDGPTFSDLAKTLKFRNREKNPIKELELEMTFEESHLEILPALLEIDRYQLAVGGIQNLDMSYDYHISVLKSPIPFKTGVGVTGNYDDYNISLLSKAKYKYYFTDRERLLKKADSLILNRKKDILAQLDFE